MAAGTIPLSMTQQFNEYSQPLAGGALYIIVSGTVSTPQDAFQDTALTIKQPYPMTLDAAGRIPQFFLDNSVNSTVKIRLQDSHGVVQLTADQVLVIGPASGGGGGGGTVDPTTIYQTGDMKPRYGTGSHTGWVRSNGLTIGSATSGATERANLDCQALFQYLWGADTSLAVSSGRGASAAADWASNKQLSLPDGRGRVFAGLDDMGNTNANRIGGAVASSTLGAAGGIQLTALSTANLPAYAPSGSVSGSVSVSGSAGSGQASNVAGGTGSVIVPSFSGGSVNPNTLPVSASGGILATFSGTAQGGTSTAFSLVQPTMVITMYLKL